MSQQSGSMNESKNERIVLNVGGKRFQPYQSTLRAQPDMPLAWITNNKEKIDYDPETGEIFFDRHPMVFTQILNYFQTGKLHCPRGMCGPCFQDELTFWGIHEQQMESCCWPNYTSHREAQENLKALDFEPKYFKPEYSSEAAKEREARLRRQETDNFWDTYKPVIWELLEEPYSSSSAKVYYMITATAYVPSFMIHHPTPALQYVPMYGWISLIFVVISIITATLWTIPFFREEKTDAKSAKLYLLIAEGICTVWFSCEFVLRLAFCPHLKTFLTNYRNWIDLISIIPAYFIILNASSFFIDVLTVFRIFRIFRFLKLLYDLQIIGKTFKASSNLFLVLFFVLLIPVLVCSSVLFYTESNYGNSFSKPKYNSIPASSWWGIVTITTVGYGDLSPTTLAGKIFGIFCALCGVMLVSMSASIAGSSFVLYYNLARAQMKIPRNRQKFNIDVESLPTVINFDNVLSLSSSPEDSGFERSSGSANSEHINIRKCMPFGKENSHKDTEDNGTFIIGNSMPDTPFNDEGYFDLVKKSYLA